MLITQIYYAIKESIINNNLLQISQTSYTYCYILYITLTQNRLILQIMQNNKLQIIKDDPYLEPYQPVFKNLHNKMHSVIESFSNEGGLNVIADSYKKFGLQRKLDTKSTYLYEEWAPEIDQLTIFGDFNNWNRTQYHAKKNEYGHWKCEFTLEQPIKQYSKVKCQVKLKNGSYEDRIPAWIKYTHQNQDKSFDGVFIQLNQYKFKNPRPSWENKNLRIYQCHIGMSRIQARLHTFNQFTQNVLPRIHKAGYNVIQIMAILEHPYYGSFGYHVSNFFSVSSRFGKPDDFKKLVDQAHKLDIKVIIDIVHAHAAKNKFEGINYWDGTQYQYFHSGELGTHSQWDSRIFNYSKYQVLRFLLSNIKFWLEQYNADGFRFDGVTSILYKHHGINYGFTGNYNEYFDSKYLDEDAIVYLMIANLLSKSIYDKVILIAEDVSGFPGLCRSLQDGGIGFNFRLAMALPDMWIKLLKEVRDEDWDIEMIAHQLTNRRWKQNNICYAQSHDQALVGDKTLSMWLFDAQVYTNMSVLNQQTPIVFRGMALHKMIRLVTFGLGGQAYLNFMGNQFGHPEWIDFPREGNGWSYHHCRRRWDLAEDKDLRYHFLGDFDKKMIGLDIKYNILNASHQYIRYKHNSDKVLVFEKGDLLFVFNWHPQSCHNGYKIYVKSCKKLKVLWSTDDYEFGGHGRVAHQTYDCDKVNQFCSSFLMYLPNRSATVFQIIEKQSN